MFSSTSSWIIFGVIALVAVVVIWKWWNKPKDNSKKNEELLPAAPQMITEQETGPPPMPSEAPPMVFAVNDGGNLDLADMSGKILNIGYGPNPKTYIGLLDLAEKDVTKVEEGSSVRFESRVGNTKLYQAVGRPYIINYTRL
jgi:hypothetical protein